MPTFATPGEITPGQLGPTSVVPRPVRYECTYAMSFTGMPSVMHTTRSMPVSPTRGSPRPRTAAARRPSTCWRPPERRRRRCRTPGCPRRPGRPCLGSRRPRRSCRRPGSAGVERAFLAGEALTTSLVSAPTRMLTRLVRSSVRSRGGRPAASSIVAADTMRGWAASAMSARPSSAFVPSSASPAARSPRRGRGLRALPARRGRTVMPEDVDEHDLDGGVGEHDLERGRHLVGARASADVEEVRPSRLPARPRRASTSRARPVADDADVAVELHVLQPLLVGARLHGIDRERGL